MEDSLLSYIEQLSPSWRAFFLSCLLASAQRLFSRCLLLAARFLSHCTGVVVGIPTRMPYDYHS